MSSGPAQGREDSAEAAAAARRRDSRRAGAPRPAPGPRRAPSSGPGAPARGPPGVAQLDAEPPRSRRRPGAPVRPRPSPLEGVRDRRGEPGGQKSPLPLRSFRNASAVAVGLRPASSATRSRAVPSVGRTRGRGGGPSRPPRGSRAAPGGARRARGERSDFGVLVLQDSATCHSSQMVSRQPPPCSLACRFFCGLGKQREKREPRNIERSTFWRRKAPLGALP